MDGNTVMETLVGPIQCLRNVRLWVQYVRNLKLKLNHFRFTTYDPTEFTYDKYEAFLNDLDNGKIDKDCILPFIIPVFQSCVTSIDWKKSTTVRSTYSACDDVGKGSAIVPYEDDIHNDSVTNGNDIDYSAPKVIADNDKLGSEHNNNDITSAIVSDSRTNEKCNNANAKNDTDKNANTRNDTNIDTVINGNYINNVKDEENTLAIFVARNKDEVNDTIRKQSIGIGNETKSDTSGDVVTKDIEDFCTDNSTGRTNALNRKFSRVGGRKPQ